jgi:formylglycine-generating enzyme required for sulfatase activity
MKSIRGVLLAVLVGLMALAARPDLPAGESSARAAEDVLTNSLGMKLKLVPAGKFLMGAKDGGSKGQAPEHEVAITKPFSIGMHEVTVGQFRQFAEAAKYQTQPEKDNATPTWRKPPFEQADDHPVVCVSWVDAAAFCAWLSNKEGKRYALPTEAQWEYCCRAGSQTKYSFGDDDADLPRYAWYSRNAGKKTHPVGQLQPNAWGLYDMHGNVREWCADYYKKDYYRHSPREDSPGPTSSDPFNKARETRVIRGGGWFRPEGYCPSAFRLDHGNDQAGYHSGAVGFRVVLLPDAGKGSRP